MQIPAGSKMDFARYLLVFVMERRHRSGLRVAPWLFLIVISFPTAERQIFRNSRKARAYFASPNG